MRNDHCGSGEFRSKTGKPVRTRYVKKKGVQAETCNPLISLVRLTGFEPVTYGLEVHTYCV